MSDRFKGFTVTLNTDLREEDFDRIVDAVLLMKGVCSIQPIMTTHDDYINREMIKLELKKSLLDVLQ